MSNWVLTSISIENFKSFSQCRVVVNEGFIVVTGANGSGKSNLLEAIAFAMGANASNLRGKNVSDVVNCVNVGKTSVSLSFTKGASCAALMSILCEGKRSFMLNGSTVTKEQYMVYLVEELGCPKDLNIWYISQHSVNDVMNLKPEELFRYVSLIAGSSSLMECSGRTRDQIQNFDVELTSIQNSIKTWESALKDVKSLMNITETSKNIHKNLLILRDLSTVCTYFDECCKLIQQERELSECVERLSVFSIELSVLDSELLAIKDIKVSMLPSDLQEYIDRIICGKDFSSVSSVIREIKEAMTDKSIKFEHLSTSKFRMDSALRQVSHVVQEYDEAYLSLKVELCNTQNKASTISKDLTMLECKIESIRNLKLCMSSKSGSLNEMYNAEGNKVLNSLNDIDYQANLCRDRISSVTDSINLVLEQERELAAEYCNLTKTAKDISRSFVFNWIKNLQVNNSCLKMLVEFCNIVAELGSSKCPEIIQNRLICDSLSEIEISVKNSCILTDKYKKICNEMGEYFNILGVNRLSACDCTGYLGQFVDIFMPAECVYAVDKSLYSSWLMNLFRGNLGVHICLSDEAVLHILNKGKCDNIRDICVWPLHNFSSRVNLDYRAWKIHRQTLMDEIVLALSSTINNLVIVDPVSVIKFSVQEEIVSNAVVKAVGKWVFVNSHSAAEAIVTFLKSKREYLSVFSGCIGPGGVRYSIGSIGIAATSPSFDFQVKYVDAWSRLSALSNEYDILKRKRRNCDEVLEYLPIFMRDLKKLLSSLTSCQALQNAVDSNERIELERKLSILQQELSHWSLQSSRLNVRLDELSKVVNCTAEEIEANSKKEEKETQSLKITLESELVNNQILISQLQSKLIHHEDQNILEMAQVSPEIILEMKDLKVASYVNWLQERLCQISDSLCAEKSAIIELGSLLEKLNLFINLYSSDDEVQRLEKVRKNKAKCLKVAEKRKLNIENDLKARALINAYELRKGYLMKLSEIGQGRNDGTLIDCSALLIHDAYCKNLDCIKELLGTLVAIDADAGNFRLINAFKVTEIYNFEVVSQSILKLLADCAFDTRECERLLCTLNERKLQLVAQEKIKAAFGPCMMSTSYLESDSFCGALKEINEKTEELLVKYDKVSLSIKKLQGALVEIGGYTTRAHVTSFEKLQRLFRDCVNVVLPGKRIDLALVDNLCIEKGFFFELKSWNNNERSVRSLSGGEKTFGNDNSGCPLLLFDEIDAALDETNQIGLSKVLAKLSKSHQILCVSHHQDFINFASTKLIVKQNNGISSVTIGVD